MDAAVRRRAQWRIIDGVHEIHEEHELCWERRAASKIPSPAPRYFSSNEAQTNTRRAIWPSDLR